MGSVCGVMLVGGACGGVCMWCLWGDACGRGLW